MKPDVIIILGGGTDGTLKPVLYTEERLKVFPKLYKKYFGIPVVVTGGYSTWMKFVPKYKEADVMQYLLIKTGVPKDLIFIEKKSRDTVGNVYFSKQIIKKFSNWKNILVVTTKGHEERSKKIFQKVFGEKYHFTFLGVPSKLASFKNNPNRKKYEKYIQSLIIERFFKNMKDGDDKALWEILKKHHPAHSKSKEAKLLAKEIKEAKQRFLGYTELKANK